MAVGVDTTQVREEAVDLHTQAPEEEEDTIQVQEAVDLLTQVLEEAADLLSTPGTAGARWTSGEDFSEGNK